MAACTRSLCAAMALATALGVGAAAADWREEVFAFHRGMLEEALDPPPEGRLELMCDGAGAAGDDPLPHVSFAGFDGRTASIAVLTAARPADLARTVWLRPRFVPAEERARVAAEWPELTLDWGWVYDRNGDGRIDWFAFVIGPAPVLPPGMTDPPDLRGMITKAELMLLLEHQAYRFWNVIDSDFDGAPDAMLVPARDAEGWVEGAMLLEGIGGEGAPAACCFRGPRGEGAGRECRPTATGCVTRDGDLVALSADFYAGLLRDVPALTGYVIDAWDACAMPAGALPQVPRRW